MADRFGYGEIGLDINPCRGCDDYDAPDGCKSNGGCGKPITNADRIRVMTDEELAECLERIRLCCSLDLCGRSCPLSQVCYSNAEEPKEMLDWLKQEVDDA